MTEELKKIIKEVEMLKKRKKEKVALATTTEERDKLLKEISQLEAIKKSPSALKRFGNTYLKGLKTNATLFSNGRNVCSKSKSSLCYYTKKNESP